MPSSFNKDKLSKDYYKCIQVQHLKKNNGSSYLKIRLVNKSGMINAYLWDMINFYAKEIIEERVYAIKAKEEVYNDERILNIKHIKPADNDRYDKYGYNPQKINLSKKKISEYQYNELMSLLSNYSNPIIEIIMDFYLGNKKIIINSGLLEHKQICMQHITMLDSNYRKKINQDLCVIIILIDRLKIDSLMGKIKKIDIKYYNLIKMYMMNDKEFIKKYKYIVDLISYNFNNQMFFKTN